MEEDRVGDLKGDTCSLDGGSADRTNKLSPSFMESGRRAGTRMPLDVVDEGRRMLCRCSVVVVTRADSDLRGTGGHLGISLFVIVLFALLTLSLASMVYFAIVGSK